MEVIAIIRYNQPMFLKQVQLVSVSVALAVSLGCGSLQRPEYRSESPGYQNQGSSEPQQWTRGPFKLHWPVDKVHVTQNFKPNRRRPHHGVDLDGKKNDPIYAAHEGHVIYAGSGFKGYGKMIIIQYDSEWASLYSHLNGIDVKEGDYVTPRQLIGKMGRTGRASGVHLHFELMRYKVPIDPLPMLKDEQRLVKF